MPLEIAAIASGVGSAVVQGIDASKRRKMDYYVQQKKIQDELGLAKEQQQKQAQIERYAIINQAVKSQSTKNNMAIAIGSVAIFSGIYLIYRIVKK